MSKKTLSPEQKRLDTDKMCIRDRHKEAYCVYAKHIHQVVRVKYIALGLAHLAVALQQPGMPEHLLRQRKFQSHQENRPVNGMEADNILSDQMQVCRPVLLEQIAGISVTVITDSGDVAVSYTHLADTQAEERTHWKEVLESPGTKEGYEKLQKLLEAQEDESDGENAGTETAGEEAANIHTLQLPASGIAYVKIDSFPAEYEEDQKQLFSLFDSLEGYTDLIIDVTENSGGSELYWQNLLVSPFIEESISCTNYALLADSENNRPYIENVFSEEELHPIGELPALPKLNREGLEAADYYVESVLHVSPGNYRASFEGRIWLLVGPQVYSASESFAVFCKETDFAKLVGEQTGGDGIGSLDPVFLQLPNSGILVQYTMTVSYTHLDVYKRQHLRSVPA